MKRDPSSTTSADRLRTHPAPLHAWHTLTIGERTAPVQEAVQWFGQENPHAIDLRQLGFGHGLADGIHATYNLVVLSITMPLRRTPASQDCDRDQWPGRRGHPPTQAPRQLTS
jgi:hypothetical protein